MKIMGLHCGRAGIRGLVCNHNGRILNTARIAVAAENGAIPYIQSIQSLINTLAQSNSGIDGVGITCSGQINPQTGLVMKTTVPGFIGTDLRALVHSVLDTEVYAESSVHAVLLGEHWLGAAKKHKDVVLIKLGVDVEFAALVGGRLQNDTVMSPHRPRILPDGGASISSEALSRNLEQALGRSACFEEYQELYRKGHPGLAAVLQDYSANLAVALENIETLQDPEIILVGGELAVWYDVLCPLLKTEMNSRKMTLPVREGLLGSDAAPLGAVRVCLNHFMNERQSAAAGLAARA